MIKRFTLELWPDAQRYVGRRGCFYYLTNCNGKEDRTMDQAVFRPDRNGEYAGIIDNPVAAQPFQDKDYAYAGMSYHTDLYAVFVPVDEYRKIPQFSRGELIRRVKALAQAIAEERGYTTVERKENRQKGIWCERMTKQLEQEHGPCTEEITWSGNDSRNKVVFRFRFATPVLFVQTNVNGLQVFVSFEFGQAYDCDRRENVGPWCVTETQLCNVSNGGEKLFRDLLKTVKKILK